MEKNDSEKPYPWKEGVPCRADRRRGKEETGQTVKSDGAK